MDRIAETLGLFLKRELAEENQRLQQHATARSLLVEALCKVKMLWNDEELLATLDLRAGHEETTNHGVFWVIPIPEAQQEGCSLPRKNVDNIEPWSQLLHVEICGTAVHFVQVHVRMENNRCTWITRSEDVGKVVTVCGAKVGAGAVRPEKVLIPYPNIHPMLRALAGDLPSRQQQQQQQHDDWMALRSTCKQIHDDTQPIWNHYHTLRTNQLVHDLARTVTMKAPGVSGQVRFDLKLGQIHTGDDGVQYWRMTPLTTHPDDIYLLDETAIPEVRILACGNLSQNVDRHAFHRLEGVDEIHSQYSRHLFVEYLIMVSDPFLVLPEIEQRDEYLDAIEAFLQHGIRVVPDSRLNRFSVVVQHLLLKLPPSAAQAMMSASSLPSMGRLLDLLGCLRA